MPLRLVGLVLSLLVTLPLCGAEAVWKTAFVKRGYVGNLSAPGAGTQATLHVRTPLPFDGSKVRVFGTGSLENEVALTGLWLIRGQDDQGATQGDRHPITFRGQPGITIPKGLKDIRSDEIAVPIKAGTWYVEDTYASPTFPYAYDIDTVRWTRPAEGLKPGQSPTGSMKHVRTGVIRRIDVLTTDTRLLVACYGDSITQGYGATGNAGARYPDVLSKLIDRPTLNLGVNGDTLAQNRFVANGIAGLPGVEQVIFLMGINDIVGKTGFKTAEEYAAIAKPLIQSFRDRKLKIVWCTIPPAGGIREMDSDPSKEALRVAINEWIRANKTADAIADFDKALADPNKPGWMREDYQSDRIHPNDKGYARMAEVAADALKGLKSD